MVATMAAVATVVAPLRAQDDWQVVGRHVAGENGAGVLAKGAAAPAPVAGTITACGELARPASEPYRSIVATVDELWHVHVPVYESVKVLAPHARGDCVFYSSVSMKEFVGRLMRLDGKAAEPVLYAIMAHEVGHVVHRDNFPPRSSLPTETKELEADRFAGYTLELLGIPPDRVAPYYSLAGDEFAGTSKDHGESKERVSALRHGFELGEWQEPEQSGTDLGAVAPDPAEPGY